MPKGFSYLKEEVDSFLDIVEEYFTISLTAWERVAEVDLLRYPDLNWTVDSLKRKFKELHTQKIPPEILFVPLLFAGQSICRLR
jgi:hypothetical protein